MSTETAYFNLVFRISAMKTTEATTQLSGFQGILKKVGDQSYIAGKALQTALGFATYQIVSSAIMGITGFVTDSIDAFVEFEYAMAGVARTVQDFAENETVLNEFAATMSKDLGIAVKDVAEAMQYMGSVGYDSSAIMADFNDIAKMGVALQIDLEDAIQTVVKAQQVWNKEGYTATEISDILNNMTNKTALNMEFLAGALRMGGPAAAATNTTLEEMTAILVELAETGFKGTMAGRSLNTILIQMGLSADELTGYLKDLKSQGFDVNLEAMEGFKTASPIEQIQMLARATDGLTDSQKIQVAQMVGGTNFLKQMLILLDNAEDLTTNLTEAQNSQNSTQAEFNTVMDTSEMKLRQQEERIASLQRGIGQELTPAWLGVKEAILNTAEALLTLGVGEATASSAITDQTYAVANNDEAIRALNTQYAAGVISAEEYATKLGELTTSTRELTKSDQDYMNEVESSTEALADYVDEINRANTWTNELDASLNELTMRHTNLVVAEDEVWRALNEVTSALGYASSGVQGLTRETEDSTWVTAQARAAFNLLSNQLYDLQGEIRATEDELAALDDQMYDNSHESAELRYQELLLQQQLKEGTITQKEYDNQMKTLEDQMFYNRLEAARLGLENMELERTYKDQKDEAGLLEDQITTLRNANNRLSTALDAFGEVGGDIVEMLQRLEDWLNLSGIGVQNFIDDLEDMPSDVKTTITITTKYVTIGEEPDLPPASGGSGGIIVGPYQLLAKGTDQVVNRPTAFVAGEAGPERVTVTPLNRGMNVSEPVSYGNNMGGAGAVGEGKQKQPIRIQLMLDGRVVAEVLRDLDLDGMRGYGYRP